MRVTAIAGRMGWKRGWIARVSTWLGMGLLTPKAVMLARTQKRLRRERDDVSRFDGVEEGAYFFSS